MPQTDPAAPLATSPLPLSARSEENRPREMEGKGATGDKDKDKGLMLPPPVPIKDAPAPPRMTRLPSLRELSTHLHYTPSTASATMANPLGTPGPGQSPSGSVPAAPPSLRIATGSLPHPISTPGVNQSPLIAPSPSSRLRLPASAMMRSLSSGPVSGVGTPLETVHSPSWTSRGFASGTGDIFASPQTATTKYATAPSGDSPTGGVPAPTPSSSHAGVGVPIPLQGAGREGAPAMSRTSSTNSYIQGYNNVPSLDQIRRRVSISQARGGSSAGPVLPSAAILSSGTVATPHTATATPTPAASSTPAGDGDGAAADSVGNVESPPETASTASSSEDAKGKKKEHQLRHAWTLFFDSKTYKPDTSAVHNKEGGHLLADYEMTLLTVGKFDTVEGFARHLNNVRLPSLLNKNSNYHMFKNGIRPMWEDPANANGGKWVILFRSSPPTLDTAWANLTMALVGEVLDPEDQVCGIVASNRPKIDRIQIWTRDRDDVDKMNRLGRKIVEVMGLEGREADCMSMEFQYNASNSNPPPNKFIHIPFTNSAVRSTTGPGQPRLSASGSFQGPPGGGTGLGINSSPRGAGGVVFPGTSGVGIGIGTGAQKSPTNTSFSPNLGGGGGGGGLEPPAAGAFRSRLGSGSGLGANAFAGPMGMVRLGSSGGSASPSPSVSPSPTPRPRAEKA